MLKTLFSIPFLLCALLLYSGTALAFTTEKLNLVLSDRLAQCSADFSDPQTDNKSNNMRRWLPVIYAQTGLHPLWVSTDGPGKKAETLLAVLKNSALDGLVPEQYNVHRITSLWNRRTAEELMDLDILLTLSFILYAHDAQNGRVHSEKPKPVLIKSEEAPAFDALALIETALSSPDLKQFLTTLLPQHKYYKNLRAALPRYRVLAAAGGWPPVTPGKSIHPGEQDPRIPAIGKRLWLEGFLHSATPESLVFDETLVQAVSEFQLRHGLATDGVIGKDTIGAMNIPVEKKIRQIIINLERWRSNTHDLGKKYVLVDIGGFVLEAIEEDRVMLEMAVIVGTPRHKTPVFSDQIQYIDINPFWNIPTSIARNEILVDLRKDPHYLTSNNIRIFSDWTSEAKEINPRSINWKEVSPNKISHFKLRQDPGKLNALGSLKFVFPNTYNVYMHDTPAQNLFQRSTRAFSHGCIRLSKPVTLAEFLLGGVEKGWSSEQIIEKIGTGKRTVIRLPTPLPVHITYQTTKGDQNGLASFHPDIYDLDQQLEQILFNEEQTDSTISESEQRNKSSAN